MANTNNKQLYWYLTILPIIALAFSSIALFGSQSRVKNNEEREQLRLWSELLRINNQITDDALRVSWHLVWVTNNDSEIFETDQSLRLRINHAKEIEESIAEYPASADASLDELGEKFTLVDIVDLQEALEVNKIYLHSIKSDLLFLRDTREFMERHRSNQNLGSDSFDRT